MVPYLGVDGFDAAWIAEDESTAGGHGGITGESSEGKLLSGSALELDPAMKQPEPSPIYARCCSATGVARPLSGPLPAPWPP